MKEKTELHPRNRHRSPYDFKDLISICPELAVFVRNNAYGNESIDFANPTGVKMLNKALLMRFYGVNAWDIPSGYLCPPIPGRADYIHYVADLLAEGNKGEIPVGAQVRCLDIGVGANCIYPIIGHKEYGWSFVGSDIDPISIAAANQIIEANPFLKNAVECRLQANPSDIFVGIIKKEERFDITICNPPFHASAAEALAGNLRKTKNLNPKKIIAPILNFGGQHKELWTEGGEVQFVTNMITQSRQFGENCRWFSCLISKESNLKSVYNALKKAKAVAVKTLNMGQGNKISRVVAWSFFNGQ